MPSTLRGITLGMLVVAISTSVGLAPAVAAEDSHARGVSALIDEVRPVQVENERLREDGQRDLTNAKRTIEVPTTSDGTLTLTGETGFPISVKLPGDGAAATVTPDGTVVYGEEGGVTLAVQSGSGQARVHTVVEDSGGLADLKYQFPGLKPELNANGSVTLFAESADGGVQVSVGGIAVPWATDANGELLKTAYRVEGDSVVQEVTIDEDTAFPVVADPAFQGDCGIITCTIRFDRAWTKRWSQFGGDIGAAIGAVTAAGVALAGPLGAALGVAAGVIIGTRAAIFSKQAADYYANGNCFGIKIVAPPITSVGWGTQVTRGTYNCS